MSAEDWLRYNIEQAPTCRAGKVNQSRNGKTNLWEIQKTAKAYTIHLPKGAEGIFLSAGACLFNSFFLCSLCVVTL